MGSQNDGNNCFGNNTNSGGLNNGGGGFPQNNGAYNHNYVGSQNDGNNSFGNHTNSGGLNNGGGGFPQNNGAYNHNPQNGRSNEASGPFGNPKWDNSDRPEDSAQVNHSGGGNPLPNQHQSDAEVASQPKEEVSKVAFATDTLKVPHRQTLLPSQLARR